MFDYKSSKDYRFTWPVTVLVPTMDGQKEGKFRATFRLIDKEETAAIDKDFGNGASNEIVRRAWVGWDKDLTENGQALDFSEAKRDELYALQFISTGIGAAYWRAIGGALREGN